MIGAAADVVLLVKALESVFCCHIPINAKFRCTDLMDTCLLRASLIVAVIYAVLLVC